MQIIVLRIVYKDDIMYFIMNIIIIQYINTLIRTVLIISLNTDISLSIYRSTYFSHIKYFLIIRELKTFSYRTKNLTKNCNTKNLFTILVII